MHPIRGKFKDIVSEEFDLEIEPREFDEGTKMAAGTPNALFPIKPEKLIEATDPEPIDL